MSVLGYKVSYIVFTLCKFSPNGVATFINADTSFPKTGVFPKSACSLQAARARAPGSVAQQLEGGPGTTLLTPLFCGSLVVGFPLLFVISL